MHLIQVTLGSAATPVIASAVQPSGSHNFSLLFIQNNAAHVVRVGDSTVSSSKGIALAAGSSTTQPALAIVPGYENVRTLEEIYLFGTAADVIDLMVWD